MDTKYESKSIVGKDVMDSGAKTIGKLKDIVIDIGLWSIECILVRIPRNVSKELGIGGIMGATVRIQPGDIEQIGDVIRLKLSAEEIVQKAEIE